MTNQISDKVFYFGSMIAISAAFLVVSIYGVATCDYIISLI